jgi:PAS domain S-box-containing protein
MLAPSIPPNEAARLAALASYQVLDTPPEPGFDGLTRLAALLLGVPIALVSLVDADRQWFKSRYGLDVPETPRRVSFCGHVVALEQPLIVPDALQDPRFEDNPLVTGAPGIRFYAGYPLRTPDGLVVGTLCAIDHKPRAVTPEQLELLGTLAREAVDQLELRRRTRLLSEQRARLQGVLEAAPDAIVTIDERGLIESTNAAASRHFGWQAGEMVGRNVSMLLPGALASMHDSFLQRHRDTGQKSIIGAPREGTALRKDGSTFACELSVGEVALGERKLFTGIVRDITLRKQAEQRREQALVELQKSQRDLLEVLNQLSVGTLVVDADETIVFASRTSILAGGPSVECGRKWHEHLPVQEPDRRAIEAMLRRPEPERTRLELPLHHADRRLWVELEVRDDPRDASRRIFYVYDLTDVHALREQLAHGRRGLMVGDSEAMRALYGDIERIAQGEWTVLIEGETGTGKELVAQAIHGASARRAGPFITVNCAGLTESILGSQLFGHVKGAFTGAIQDRQGLFEAAAGGTLLLDEIGDVALPIQSALLRALQEKEITRLGEARPRKVDVRILAATHRDLRQRVVEGQFREDLLYRIRNARVRVPPLRERREDIALLVASFLAEERVTGGKLITEVSPDAMKCLMRHRWPGNVRELRGAIEHASIRCSSRRIGLRDLPSELVESPPEAVPQEAEPPRDERSRILAALRRSGGNRARAARLLNIGRATLYRRLSELAITEQDLEALLLPE